MPRHRFRCRRRRRRTSSRSPSLLDAFPGRGRLLVRSMEPHRRDSPRVESRDGLCVHFDPESGAVGNPKHAVDRRDSRPGGSRRRTRAGRGDTPGSRAWVAGPRDGGSQKPRFQFDDAPEQNAEASRVPDGGDLKRRGEPAELRHADVDGVGTASRLDDVGCRANTLVGDDDQLVLAAEISATSTAASTSSGSSGCSTSVTPSFCRTGPAASASSRDHIPLTSIRKGWSAPTASRTARSRSRSSSSRRGQRRA